MSETAITILSPGMMTTVQDEGRFGYQRYGMPVSGAMDLFSYRAANLLAGNESGAACLEATLTGPEILFHARGIVAITGADMGPRLNGKPVSAWKTLEINCNDQLSFSGLASGCRTYIAFRGGLDVPVMMGSRSTYLRAGIGGLDGRILKAGDRLPLGKQTGVILFKKLPVEFIPRYTSPQKVRVIPGPEVIRFAFEGIRNFLVSDYTITPQSDRMGYRLSGPPLSLQSGTNDIVSAGISAGTIQVTNDGQPILLMADRQTTGGYTRIANVISADLPLVAQMKPGDVIRFSEITLGEAQNLLREQHRILELLNNDQS